MLVKMMVVDRTGIEPVASRILVRWFTRVRIAKRALCQAELPALQWNRLNTLLKSY